MAKASYLPEIDGLRAIAILSVVLYHAGIGPRGGFQGVDVFFVISGYLLTLLLLLEKQQTNRIDLLAFYARRVRRILPTALVVIFTTVALSSVLLPAAALSKVADSAISSVLFWANYFFLRNSGGYFDGPSDEMPLLHLWSLSVEEQFYFVWPLLMMTLISLHLKSSKLLLSAFILVSILFAEYLLRKNPDAAFFTMPSRFWELAIGGFVAMLKSRPTKSRLLALCGMGAILIGITFSITHFPGIGAIPVVLGTAILIWIIHSKENLGIVHSFLTIGPLTFIGRISYSLYLWHWPLLAIYRATSVDVSTFECLIICGIAGILAFFTYRYVETPVRERLRAARAHNIVIFGLVASLTIPIAVFAFDHFKIVPEQNIQEQDLATRVENDRTPYQPGCMSSPIDPPRKFPDAECASKRGVNPKVAMIGDSYGAAWRPVAWEIAKKLNLSAIDYSRSGCPAFLQIKWNDKLIRDSICGEYNLALAEKVRGFDTVVIATRWNARPISVDEEGIRAMLAAISPYVRKIYVIGPSPVLREPVPKCIRANKLDACTVRRDEFNRDSEPIKTFLELLPTEFRNVDFIELGDFLCTQAECLAMKDGVALYFDDSHVTYAAAQKFAAGYVSTRAF
jgi:peptidoglycan/LPS O-acetylase OafA/YrhL